jgi:two-component system chemotaxis response regulator CheY
MKILIVEDDTTSLVILQKILEPMGRIDSAADGDQAIKLFTQSWKENSPYAVLFLDIMLPGHDGHSVLKEIRRLENEWNLADTRKLKVIMVTALEDPQNVVEAFYQGEVDSYIIKPVNSEKITREMREIGLLT